MDTTQTSKQARFIERVVVDCWDYMAQYHCDIETAVRDWEGDGLDGGWGLTAGERAAVLAMARGNTEL